MIPKPTWKECYEHQRIGRRIRKLDREFYASDITDVRPLPEFVMKSNLLKIDTICSRRDNYSARLNATASRFRRARLGGAASPWRNSPALSHGTWMWSC